MWVREKEREWERRWDSNWKCAVLKTGTVTFISHSLIRNILCATRQRLPNRISFFGLDNLLMFFYFPPLLLSPPPSSSSSSSSFRVFIVQPNTFYLVALDFLPWARYHTHTRTAHKYRTSHPAHPKFFGSLDSSLSLPFHRNFALPAA